MCYKFWYISAPSSSKQRREITLLMNYYLAAVKLHLWSEWRRHQKEDHAQYLGKSLMGARKGSGRHGGKNKGRGQLWWIQERENCAKI